jgi:hypothetical protein
MSTAAVSRERTSQYFYPDKLSASKTGADGV